MVAKPQRPLPRNSSKTLSQLIVNRTLPRSFSRLLAPRNRSKCSCKGPRSRRQSLNRNLARRHPLLATICSRVREVAMLRRLQATTLSLSRCSRCSSTKTRTTGRLLVRTLHRRMEQTRRPTATRIISLTPRSTTSPQGNSKLSRTTRRENGHAQPLVKTQEMAAIRSWPPRTSLSE